METTESKALQFANWVVNQAIRGVPKLDSAEKLAREYLNDKSYTNNDERVASLINWETSKNFTWGFMTGLGGVFTMPFSIPSAIGASWIIQARMAGAIAVIYGHDLNEDRVRTLILLSVLGDSAKEVLKQAGIKAGTKLTQKLIMQIPGKTLIEINKKVGFRFLTKAGEKGAVNLIKVVPVAGGIVGGIFDAATCRAVGNIAKKLFKPEK